MVVLCGAHHRAVHRGTLLLDGNVSEGLVFRHADGTRYGGPVDVETASACVEAQSALRSFGFGESESRRAVLQARESSEKAEEPGELVRAALRLLRPRLCVRERRASYDVGGRPPPIELGGLCVAPLRQAKRPYPMPAPHTARRALAPAHAPRGGAEPEFRRETGTAVRAMAVG